MPKQYQGGLFSPPVFNATADPFNDSRGSALNLHGMTKGEKQMCGAVGIKSKFNRLYEGEEYQSMSKLESRTRMKGKEKFLTPNGFKQSSGLKTASCASDWSTTFQRKPPVYIPEMESRGPKTKKEDFKNRLVYTQPPKKPSGSAFSTPNIHFTKFNYASSPYDAAHQVERARTAEGKKKTEGKPPFKGISLGTNPLDVIPGSGKREAGGAGPGGGGTGSPGGGRGMSASGTRESLASTGGRKKKVDGAGEGEEKKPFVPSSTLRSGAEYSVFTHWPEHKAEPYDDKILRGAGSTGRLLPMAEQMKEMPVSIRERRPWSPTNPAKSMYTRVLEST